GRHLWFRLPADCDPVPCSAGKLGEGIDTRGDGGYIVAPPSVHASGPAYQFEPGSDPANIEPAVAPDWLLQALAGDRAQAQAAGASVCIDELRVSDDIKRLIRESKPKGQRSEAVFAALRALVTAGHGDATILAVILDPLNKLSEKPREKGRA